MKNSYFWIVLGFPVWKRITEFSIRHKDWNDFNYKSTPSLGLILIGINNPVILSHKFVDLQCPTFYWKRWFSSDVKQKQQRVVVKIFHFMYVNFTDFRMKTANICCIHEKKIATDNFARIGLVADVGSFIRFIICFYCFQACPQLYKQTPT